MIYYAVYHFSGKIKPFTVSLEIVDDPPRLNVMLKPRGIQSVQNSFSGMTERRMPEVVPERYRLG